MELTSLHRNYIGVIDRAERILSILTAGKLPRPSGSAFLPKGCECKLNLKLHAARGMRMAPEGLRGTYKGYKGSQGEEGLKITLIELLIQHSAECSSRLEVVDRS